MQTITFRIEGQVLGLSRSAGKEATCNSGDLGPIPRSERSPGEGIGYPGYPLVFLGFPCGAAGKESACNAGDPGSIPGLGRSPGIRERLPTPLFWPGEFQGWSSLWGGRVGRS